MCNTFFLLLLLFSTVCAVLKNIEVSGVFTCTCKVSPTKCGRTFNLYMLEEDNEFWGDYDDVLVGKTSIDWEKPFTIAGQDDEIGLSEPYIIIHHFCPNGVFTETTVHLPKISADYFINFGRISFSADDYVLQLNSVLINESNSTVL